MLDLLLKLIEKLIEFSKERQRVTRSLHDDFLLPLMQQFENVQQEYISTLQNYRELISSNADNFNEDNPVFSKLESDMIYTHLSRGKLAAMLEGLVPMIDSYNFGDEFFYIDRFISAMDRYIRFITSTAGEYYRNFPREDLLQTLHKISIGESDSFYKDLTPTQQADIEVLDKIKEMQQLYTSIQHSYQKAKKVMLK